jgi:hypothetical protein
MNMCGLALLNQVIRQMGLIWLLILDIHMYLSGVWLGMDLRMVTKKTFVFTIRIWTTCSKFVTHSKFSSQRNGREDTYKINE